MHARGITKYVGIATASLIAMLVMAGPVSAVSWGTLTAYEAGVAQAQAKGDLTNNGYVYARSASSQYDKKPGGNYIRVETRWQFWKYNSICGSAGTCWVNNYTDGKTTETNTALWEYFVKQVGLDGQASQVRGRINVCEVQAWSPDECSDMAYPSFSY